MQDHLELQRTADTHLGMILLYQEESGLYRGEGNS